MVAIALIFGDSFTGLCAFANRRDDMRVSIPERFECVVGVAVDARPTFNWCGSRQRDR